MNKCLKKFPFYKLSIKHLNIKKTLSSIENLDILVVVVAGEN